MNTDQLLDALCALTPPLCSLAEDTQVQEALDHLVRMELPKLSPTQAWGHLLGTLAPLLLQTHREETLRIASVLTGTPLPALRAQSGLATLAALRDSWDADLICFFGFAAGTDSRPC